MTSGVVRESCECGVLHVEIENTTADSMCVEVARYPSSGKIFGFPSGWLGQPIDRQQLNVAPFGSVKHVIAKGSLVGTDSEGPLRIGACSSPANFVPGALHVSTYANDATTGRFIHYFVAPANDGSTRSSW